MRFERISHFRTCNRVSVSITGVGIGFKISGRVYVYSYDLRQ